ncbi:hypothetical protein D9611_014580 [Ephemerocybe angulata]|uniref:Uncharacterized protein n=1 Tax=Ephemerocybe angulata TaxID=980116 RepID=A0A8H5C451_9AGAR|nr:hypothetical protein D9611_014580 [Tulosesus angulatus]
MASQNISDYPDLAFNFLTNKKLYEKAFCVDPRDDICPFGTPCPNPDVTGIGQQISIYITTIIYAIVLAYIPWLQRPMLYAHLSVLYSLHIAALVSALKGDLSRGDGIFVIVTVASPATLYLWYYTAKSFWNANHFPIQHENKDKPANQSWEVKIARLFSLGSFLFEIAMICVLFIPNVKGVKFPQTACDKQFGTTALWFNVVWELPVIIQTVGMLIIYFIAYGIILLWTKRQAYEVPSPSLEPYFKDLDSEKNSTTRRENIDIVSWTERVMFDIYPNFMNRSLFICLVTIVQVSALPDLSYVVSSKDSFTFLLIAFGLFREMPRKESNKFLVFAVRIFILLFFAGVWLLRMLFGLFLVPNSADWVILFIACSAAWWSWSHFSSSNMKIFLPILTNNHLYTDNRHVSGISVFLALGITEANVWVAIVGDPKSFDFGTQNATKEDADGSYFTMQIVTVVTWIICWLSASAWPWQRTLTLDKFYKGLFKRAHLLKVFWIVLGPHILWIQASDASNLSHPTDMNFGQIFALIVSIVTVVTLLDEAKDVKKDIWLAILKSDVMFYEEVEQPKHYAPRPGLGMS